MTTKPRITLTRGFAGRLRWACRGKHPGSPRCDITTTGWGKTPSAAYLEWLKFWEIPF